MLKPGGQIEGDEALEFYAKHTAQIEVQGKPVAAGGFVGGYSAVERAAWKRKSGVKQRLHYT